MNIYSTCECRKDWNIIQTGLGKKEENNLYRFREYKCTYRVTTPLFSIFSFNAADLLFVYEYSLSALCVLHPSYRRLEVEFSMNGKL